MLNTFSPHIRFREARERLGLSPDEVAKQSGVPMGNSRALAGWRHDLFTLLLGIWSPAGLVSMPLLLILNLRGGMDVTAHYSDASIDPLRVLPPDPTQAKRDLLLAQWTFIVLGLAVVGTVFYFYSPFPK